MIILIQCFFITRLDPKTALINKYLKNIATKAEITKNITTHTARHSFADIARQKTDNIYNLSKTLGHSSLKDYRGIPGII